MVQRYGGALLVLVVAWMAAPAPAQAQAEWRITPYLGANVAGDVEDGKGGLGGSIAYLGGRLGFEFDLQRYHHFFKDSEVFPRDPNAAPNCIPGPVAAVPCTDIDTDAMGFMGNVVVPIRIPGATRWRPYATAGLGLIRAWTNEEDRQQNNVGFNGGGGVMFSVSEHVGLRGDLRYFRALVDENASESILFRDYGFLRVSLGVTIRFPR